MSHVRRRKPHVSQLQATSLLRFAIARGFRPASPESAHIPSCARPGELGKGHSFGGSPSNGSSGLCAVPELAESNGDLTPREESKPLLSRPEDSAVARFRPVSCLFCHSHVQRSQLRQSSTTNKPGNAHLPKVAPRGQLLGKSPPPLPASLRPKTATPNPSIEGTLSGLRPPSAPHVKR
jgi:hypothetical protein